MTSSSLAILLLAVFLSLDLLSIAARTAFEATTHVRLVAIRDQPQAELAMKLHPRLPRLRPAFSLILVISRFAMAGILVWLVGMTWIGALILAAAALLLVWVEALVDRTSRHNPEAYTLRLAGFSQGLMVVLWPFLALLPADPGSAISADGPAQVMEDEVRSLLDAGQQEGAIEQDEVRMITSIFDLGDQAAREIMVPRIDMLALAVDTPLPEAIDALLRSGHSRVPVYEESVDNTLGLLYAKDLLREWRSEDKAATLRSLLRPAYFVPESKKLDELLAEMQSKRIHMAVVVDEYGGVAGLVTLEDIVEEFLGEIQDEYDTSEEAPYQQLESGGYTFLGRIMLDDFNEIMNSNLNSEEADTLGGYIYARLGRVPTLGETVREEDLLLTVEQVSARRIRKVTARWVENSSVEKDEK